MSLHCFPIFTSGSVFMYNQTFRTSSIESKKQKLEKVIRHQHPHILPEYLEQIFAVIDFGKQYHVKVTGSITKFQNIVTNERIVMPEKNIESESFPIYGSFFVGLYENIAGEVRQEPAILDSSREAAAIKVVKDQEGTVVKEAHLLVLYKKEF